MGAFVSVPISTANNYTLGGAKFKVSIAGGKPALSKVVCNGDALRVDLIAETTPASAATKYLRSEKFVKDLNKYILSKETGVASEYNLPINATTLEDLSWTVKKEPTVKGKTISVTINLKAKNEHTFYETCAFIAGCIAWFVKSGSIPVSPPRSMAVDDWVQITGANFALQK